MVATPEGVTVAAISPLHITWLPMVLIVGVGFTVTVKPVGVAPVQVMLFTYTGVTTKFPMTGEEPVLDRR